MAASTSIFVLIGIGTVTANLMRIIAYLDTPHPRTRRARTRSRRVHAR